MQAEGAHRRDSRARFWTDPVTLAALHSRDFATLFRLYSTSTRTSQTQLGMAVGLSQGQVSQVMNGTRRLARLDLIERVADGLRMPDGARHALGLAPRYLDQPPPAAATPFGYAASAGAAVVALRREIDSGALSSGPAYRPAGFVTASRDWLIAQGADPTPGSYLRQLSQPRAQMVHNAFAMFQELDTLHGGAHAHAALVQYLRHEALPLLDLAAPEHLRREVLFATAELAYLAGLTAADSGACGAAEYYYPLALRLAEEADDDAFAANVLAAMAQLAIMHGEGTEAVQLASAGLTAARRSGIDAVVMRLSIALARAHAIAGNRKTSLDAVTDAEAALGRIKDPGEFRWTRFLDGAYLLGETATCFLELKDARRAADLARESAQVNVGRRRRAMLSHAALAIAHGQARNAEAGQAALGQALDLADGVQSARALRAVAEAAAILRPLTRGANPTLVRADTLLAAHSSWRPCRHR